MGFDFDDKGQNDEYGASANESTGEPGDEGKRVAGAPITVTPTPQLSSGASDLIAAIMGPSQTLQVPQTAAAALEATQDAYMEEVEMRLEVASYYRILLSNPMFDNGTQAANLVEHEVRGFIRERLGVLLSIGTPAKKETTFSDPQVEVLKLLGDLTPEHVTALKMVASKVLGATPTVREEPIHRPAPVPAAPSLRQAPTPPPRATRAPPAPAPAQATAPAPVAAPRGPGRPPGAKNKPKEGEMIQAVRKHPDGSEEPLFNRDGSPRMVKVGPRRVQRPAGALPFPTDLQLEQVAAIQATQRAQVLEQNPQVQKAFAGLKNPV